MPKLYDIVPDKTIKKMKNMKYANASKGFVGATPNLNSSLGINAADGTDQSATSQFLEKNQGVVDAVTGALGSLFGTGKSASSNVPVNTQAASPLATPPPAKSGFPVWGWIAIAVVAVVIVVLIIKRKK